MALMPLSNLVCWYQLATAGGDYTWQLPCFFFYWQDSDTMQRLHELWSHGFGNCVIPVGFHEFRGRRCHDAKEKNISLECGQLQGHVCRQKRSVCQGVLFLLLLVICFLPVSCLCQRFSRWHPSGCCIQFGSSCSVCCILCRRHQSLEQRVKANKAMIRPVRRPSPFVKLNIYIYIYDSDSLRDRNRLPID